MTELTSVRLDRWLWAARFFKTRAQAKRAIEGGKVQLRKARPKAAKEIGVGCELTIRRGDTSQTITVTGLADRRGSATVARTLYEESDASIELREADRSRRRMERAGLTVPRTRPTKRDRRELKKLKQDSQQNE
ncbi:MAG: S4 domain-containing protein [Gammaproteobacteria bacterium]|nr:S4 domain-containing protein [Gammaproteobacteria bacterium]MCZ6853444.1 S4 domain-containing protein [Gammaproteobacteria bacterium]